MPTKNPRIQVVLEKPLYRQIKKKAQQDGLSLSLEIRDIVKDWLAEHPQERIPKPYTGKNMEKLIGIFEGGKNDDLDALLVDQVHGIPD